MSLIDSEQDQVSSIAALRAYEFELTEGADKALEFLLPLRDAIRVDATLRILIRSGRVKSAADLIRDLKPDPKWSSRASYIFAFLGELDLAMDFVSFADQEEDLANLRLTRLGFAEGLLNAWADAKRGSSLHHANWTQDERELAGKALGLLDPVLAVVESNRKISNDTELYGVQYAIQLSEICQRGDRVQKFIKWLLQFSPVPLVLGELALTRKIDVPEGLTTRFEIEHPANFQARYLCALIERDVLKNSDRAFSILEELAKLAETDSERESVCIRIFETVFACTSKELERAIDIVEKLLPNDQRLSDFLKVFQLMEGGAIDEARRELEGIRNEQDEIWWQAQAQLCELEGNEDEAQAAWVKAGELLPHKDVISRGIQASIDQRRLSSAIRGLETLLKQEPQNERALSAIAWSLSQLGDHPQSIGYLERLVTQTPNDPDYRIRLANCFVRTNRPAEAIRQLREACALEEAPVEATFMLSEVLGPEDPGESFELLDAISADHWDDPSFVMLFMKCAHAASEESRASEAMARLIELRSQGKVSSAVMRPMTLEEVLEFGKQREEGRKTLQEAVINGRMPWLFVEQLANNPVSWAWRLHTQKLSWNSEERLSRAACSIYSTNAFTPMKREDEKSRLELISMLDTPDEVVVDITALVTLHELGCLRLVATSIGKLVLPSSYGDMRHRDTDRLSDHQPVIRHALAKIDKAITNGDIKVTEVPSDAVRLDQYSDESINRRISINDVADILEGLQKCSDTTLANLRGRASTAVVSDVDEIELRVGNSISAELFSLKAIAETDAFQTFVDTFTVYLDSTDQARIRGELSAYAASDQANESQQELWNMVGDLIKEGLAEWRSMKESLEVPDDEDDEELENIYMDSVELADDLAIPLLADDRVLQVISLQGHPLAPNCAFDSQQILLSLHRRDAIELDVLATHIMQLIKWRYRFLTPPSDVLYTWLKKGLKRPPGPDLIEAACYLHDCLRDPGLHCGLESTDPPMPIALRFVSSWTEAIAKLLAKVWSDKEIDVEVAKELTAWVCTEFVPSCPRGLYETPVGFQLAQKQARSVLKLALVQFTIVPDQKRANLGLRTIGSSIGLSDEEFLAECIEGLDVAKP